MTLIDSCWHNRFIQSRSGIWLGCRNGAQEQKFGYYQRPDSKLIVSTSVNASYFITRAYLNFHTQGIGAVTSARLGLYVTDIYYNFVLCITKGLWDEPVTPEDFGLQTDETTNLGQKSTADMVLNQYNWIDLNAAGIAWINQRPVEINQHESYDWQKTSGHPTYSPWRWSESFTPLTTHNLTSVKLRGWRTGSPGTFTVYLKQVDANHMPTGPVLASGSINANTLPSAQWGDWFKVIFSAGYAISADTEYCLEYLCPDGNSSNCVNLAGATATPYPNGYRGYSNDNGVTWTPSATRDIYFIEYSADQVGGTKFCLRTSLDLSDVPPGSGATYTIHFHSAQKGVGYLPLLDLSVAAGASASLAGKLVAAHFI